MLSVFANSSELLSTTKTVTGKRLQALDTNLMSAKYYGVTLSGSNDLQVSTEFHLYTTAGTYITGDHKITTNTGLNDTINNDVAPEYLVIDLKQRLTNLGLTKGTYKVVTNVFDNIVGSYDTQQLWIKEISPSRTELRLQLADNTDVNLIRSVTDFQKRWELNAKLDTAFTYLLNFGFNKTYQVVNFRFDIDLSNVPEIVVKLYQPLPSTIGEKSKLWISEEVIPSVIQTVNIVPKSIDEEGIKLLGPNFNIEEYTVQSVATDFKSWNDLLASNISNSQKIIDKYVSGSTSIGLNIQYNLFDNFIHYGSAVEQVENFYYKMQLIESYSDKIRTLKTSTISNYVSINVNEIYNQRNAVVSSFSNFEKYLFFDSDITRLYTHITGSVSPWPKQSVSSGSTWLEAFDRWAAASFTFGDGGVYNDPYQYFESNYSVSASVSETYYSDLLEQASVYDKYNVHSLINTVPTHMLSNEGSEEFSMFVNMLGQHYDIIWSYVSHLTDINIREENPKAGVSDELLYDIAKTFGWELINGKSTTELWKYALGVESGTTENPNALTTEQSVKEVWRRIVNNLPYILKTKGTIRSVKALLNCFGIPSTFLSIKEYGGPSTYTEDNHFPSFENNTFNYAWRSTGSAYLSIPYSGSIADINPNTIEFRFKTDNNSIYTSGSSYNLLQLSSSLYLDLTKQSAVTNKGTLTFYATGTAGLSASLSVTDLEVFDNTWHTVAVSFANDNWYLDAVKSLYGKTVYHKSSSLDLTLTSSVYTLFASASNETVLYFGTGSNKLNGHIQEIRLWSGSLNSGSLQEHAKSPSTYTYNVDRFATATGDEALAAYNHLINRFSLLSNTVNSGSIYIDSIHPNQSLYQNKLYFNGYATQSVDYISANAFEGFEEIYYLPTPSLGNNSLYSNKVRIESSSLNGILNTKTRVEVSSYDKYSADSNKLGIYFSPQNAINEDIFNQLGYFEIDDYIGDPSRVYEDSYPILTSFSSKYWKKYSNKNDFEAYFRSLQDYDFTLFEYIKRLVPLRTNLISGLVIEPNVLERSKVKAVGKPSWQNLYHTSSINITDTTLVSSNDETLPDAAMSGSIATVIGEYKRIRPGTISPIGESINILTGSWSQTRQIGKFTIKESGSYTPIQKVILDARPSVELLVPNTNLSDIFGNVLSFESYPVTVLAPPFSGEIAELITGSLNPGSGPGSELGIRWSFNDSNTGSFGYPATGSNGTVQMYVQSAPFGLYFGGPWTLGFSIFIPPTQYINQEISMRLNSYYISNSSKVDITVFDYDALPTYDGFETDYLVKIPGTTTYINDEVKFRVENTKGIYIVFWGVTQLPSIGQGKLYIDDIVVSGLFKKSDIQDFQKGSMQHISSLNQTYGGAKLTGPAINVNSSQTIDGGPVVKITKVNPNQLTFADKQITTIDQNISGIKTRKVSDDIRSNIGGTI
jgi:hypothetical protein